ncbi:MAG: DEAD/DEAH box helicase [Myxococcota bacterium]
MFAQFNFSDTLLKVIKDVGFEKPSLIQEKVIPHIMEGRDLIGQAKTGTGKTAAFAWPSIEKIQANLPQVQMLVIAPTRELATQVCEEIQRFGRPFGIKCVSISGGSSYARQIDAIKQGGHVVVATPGRLLDLMNSRRIPKMNPKIVVLDEADEMLDMGFLDDIQSIFEYLPAERQTLLFSATMPPAIQKLAQKILKDPLMITTNSGKEITNQDIQQEAYIVEEGERKNALIRLLDAYQPPKSIVFCRTRADCDQLNQSLQGAGYSSAALHGDLEQRQRERVLAALKEGKISVLVATDVAARGLNVTDVSHVFNYHLPMATESYVHRIGRTGRAGNKGIALTLVTPREMHKLKQIQAGAGSPIGQKRIPSLQDVKKNKLSDLTKKLGAQVVNPDAQAFLQTIEDSANKSEITLKLLSMYLSSLEVAGPDKIGVDPERLSQMERAPRPDQKRNRGGGYGRFDDKRRGRSFQRR